MPGKDKKISIYNSSHLNQFCNTNVCAEMGTNSYLYKNQTGMYYTDMNWFDRHCLE